MPDWLKPGASVWLGSVFCMLAVAVPMLATQAEDGWQAIASLVNTFSPVALSAAAVVLMTGLLTAWLRLGGVSPLWTTGYGRTLLIKLLMLVGVAGAGAYNWKRMRPALGTAQATARFRRSAATELAFGVAVILVTAVLVALPVNGHKLVMDAAAPHLRPDQTVLISSHSSFSTRVASAAGATASFSSSFRIIVVARARPG